MSCRCNCYVVIIVAVVTVVVFVIVALLVHLETFSFCQTVITSYFSSARSVRQDMDRSFFPSFYENKEGKNENP